MSYKIEGYDLKEILFVLLCARNDIKVGHDTKERKLNRKCSGCYSCLTSLPGIQRSLEIIKKVRGFDVGITYKIKTGRF